MNHKLNILVTGANGQLGHELQSIAGKYEQLNFIFTDQGELSIVDEASVQSFFKNTPINFCINCAAYTAVDKAESEKEKAFVVNAEGVGNLSKACAAYKAPLIHISTDYVFDGTATTPYTESQTPHPVSIYGESKLAGEQLALQNNPDTIIIRTSWLFSTYGNNFVKTMIRLMNERESISVVNDQMGCPTYAADLAEAIINIILNYSSEKAGIYHFSNQGAISWFDFAVAIKELINSNCMVNSITTEQYPTAAKRPQYSVFDTAKVRNIFHIEISGWKAALERCIKQLH